MKINILSDLHLEKGEYTFPIISSDLLILAGDTCNISEPDLFKSFLNKIPVTQRTLIIMGNHEYLYYDHNNCEITLQKLLSDYPHITLLENDSIIIDGIEFIGSTLWSNFLAHGEEYYLESKAFVQKHWTPQNAFIVENNIEIPLTVDFAEEKSLIAIEYLKNKLSTNFDGKRVVITHFPPSKLSTESAYIHDKLNSYWVNNLDVLFNDKINLWIHGHIHQSKNYIHPTGVQVICNPRGNMKKVMNHDFDYRLCVDI